MARKNIVNLIAVFVLVFMLSILGATLCFSHKNASNAEAVSSTASLGSITVDDTKLIASNTNFFDQKILDKLYATIAGANSTYQDTYNYVKGLADKTLHSDPSAKNPNTITLSHTMNFADIEAKGGVKLEIGGYTWDMVFLTTDTEGSSGGNGDLIATLWLSDSIAKDDYIWSSNTNVATYPNNYSASDVRDNLKKDFADFDTGKFSAYLASPNQLKYQRDENFVWGYFGAKKAYLIPNEAWQKSTEPDGPSTTITYSGVGGWHKTTVAGVENVSGYTDWGSDKVWLPSLIETGYSHWYTNSKDYNEKCGSLWGIPTGDVICESTSTIWLRSGGDTDGSINQAMRLTADGGGNNITTTKTSSIRPAIHLNLTKVNQSAGYFYKNPLDVDTAVYDGNAQTVSSLEKKPDWYSADFDLSSNKIKYTTYLAKDNSPSPMINAGEYWVKVEFVDDYKTRYSQNAYFYGAPDVTDSAHAESYTVRWFKFKINPKPIEVAFDKNADGTVSAKAKNQADISMSDSDKLPEFGVNYTSSDGKGYTFNHPNKPDKTGEYTATAIITNGDTCNFVIDTKKPYTTTYSKSKDQITKPTLVLPTDPDTYKIDGYEYTVNNYDDTKMTMTATGAEYNASTKKLKVVGAGTYKVSFKLKTPAEACWAGDNPDDDVEYNVTIKKKPISVQGFDVTMINSADVKNATKAKVPDNKIIDVENGDTYPTILILFTFEDGTNEMNAYPTFAGKYKAKLKIENAESCNYELDATTASLEVDFNVTGAVSFKGTDLVWIATPTAGGDPIEIASPFELPFIMGGYTISVKNTTADNMSLKNKGVKIYSDAGAGDNGYSGDIQATNVGNYATTVRIVNYDNTYDNFDDEFTLNWKIVSHKVTKPSYTGGDITFSKDPADLPTLFGLPADWANYAEFEVEKNGEPFANTKISDVGTYSVTIKIKSDMTGNAVWIDADDKTTPFPVQQVVKIIPRVVQITGWDNSSGIPVPQTGDPQDAEYLKFEYSKADGTPATYNDVTSTPNTTFNVKAVSNFGDNVTVSVAVDTQDNEIFSTPGNPANPPTPVDKPSVVEDSKEYTGAPLTFDLIDFDSVIMVIDGTLTVTEVGQYSVTVRFRDGVNYCWDDGTRNPITLTFSVTEPTAPPEPPAPKEPSIGEKIKAFFNGLIESHFPLWQVLTIAVGGLLSVIFLIKSVQYGNRKKKAKGELKKYAPAKAMATLLPIFSTEVVAGLSNQIWSIIAFSVVGVTALMFIVALITRKGWKKAELAKEEAMASAGYGPQGATMLAVANNSALDEIRRELKETLSQVKNGKDSGNEIGIEEILRRQREEMEERYRQELARRDEELARREEEMRRENQRREEEQAKRDEAMKIMLANMMGRQQGADGMDMGYATMDNTDLLVQKVIAGLLPMVQQMIPEPTAYLSAPSDLQNDRYDTLTSVLQQQNDALQQQNAQIVNLQNQIADMSRNVLEAEIIPDHSEEIRAMADEHNAQIASQNAQIAELQSQIADLSQGRLEAEILPDQSEEIKALNVKLAEMQSKMDMMSSMSVDELDDEDFDDEEEWDSILDEDDDDFVEAVIIDDNGNVRKTYPNFRMRLKQSSDKNREWYAVIKNMFCSQKGVTYRVYKRVEKIRYQGQVVGVIGIAKRSIKLWLALKPYEYDARRYHHKDVSDKPRFVDVPMYVRITSDRALLRAEELILALFQELNMEARKRYNDRSIQELIFTLKHNRLLTNKQYKSLLCEMMHVHDCDVLDDETAEKCIENKHVDSIDDSYIATLKLDDIDANFQDGNRVTLERLKKVGLVPEDCTGYTVTAGQRLTKPLIIVANDFTLDAVKLITLTGGRAIRLTLI